MSTSANIYDAVLTAGRPLKLPTDWQPIPCSDGFVEITLDSHSLKEQLLTRFTADELVLANVMLPDGTLTPPLCSADVAEPIVALGIRAAPDVLPQALLVNCKLIGLKTIPPVALMQDYRLQEMLSDASDVLVVASICDLAVLWSMGLPAVLMQGLEEVGGDDLDQLSAHLGWSDDEPANEGALNGCAAQTDTSNEKVQNQDNDADERNEIDKGQDQNHHPDQVRHQGVKSSHQPRFNLIILNWSLATLSESAATNIGAVRDHFTRLQTVSQFDVDSVYVWALTEQDADDLQFGLRTTPKWVPDLLQRLLDERLQPIVPVPPAACSEPVPPGYHEVLRQWITGQASNEPDQQALWSLLRNRLEAEVLSPLHAQAVREKDPVRRQRLETLAGLSREFHTRAAIAARRHSLAGDGSAADRFDNDLLALDRRITAISESLAGTAGGKRAANSRESAPEIITDLWGAARHCQRST